MTAIMDCHFGSSVLQNIASCFHLYMVAWSVGVSSNDSNRGADEEHLRQGEGGLADPVRCYT
jgi:hypothetical protein